ncbi:hypothetical protein [Immundisolibacter sp.]
MEAEKVEYKGITIEIFQDEYSESPDQWDNDKCFLVYDHRDFFVERKGFDPQNIFNNVWEKDKLYKGYYVFGVDAYIHSGVALALKGTSEAYRFPDRRWDVSFKGFALVKREAGSYKREDAFNMAKDLIKVWNQYLSGDVWNYHIPEYDEGYYSYYGYDICLDAAKDMVDHLQEIKEEEYEEAGKN